MGKKKKDQSSLGRSLIKDRFGSNNRKLNADSMLHTTELQDGYDWGRLNVQSVTEQSSFEEFLATAELAGTEFQAEKLNIKFVNPRSNVGLLTKTEYTKAVEDHEKHKEMLRIPRRPPWTTDMTSSEVDQNERESFLIWRRSLAQLQENEDILLTPYERNLEFWRQLWRVIERSDVIVQIVDARNPLLYRCEDLEKYVKEVSSNKINLILLNKADYLNEKQRQYWADYFGSINLRVAFFSAILPGENSKQKDLTDISEDVEKINIEELNNKVDSLEKAVEESANVLKEILNTIESVVGQTVKNVCQNSSKLLTREELIDFFKTLHSGIKVTENITTIGLVGYPNVGKSSTINALMTCKKVSVSATPGKTKHFQTLYLDKELLLCDCPGLVMPSFVFTKAEMILNGILPVDQMRDHVPPVNLITSLIPRHIIEETYGIMIPLPIEGEDPDRNPTAEEVLNAYAFNRGFMTANGQPDNARAARYIIKDFLNGKLLYCKAPPNINKNDFQSWPPRTKQKIENIPPRAARAIRPYKVTTAELDNGFFSKQNPNIHAKGIKPIYNTLSNKQNSAEEVNIEKPWKKFNKHHNKNKKEKLRRVYAHLDQH